MANPGEYRLGGMLRFDPDREGHIVDKLNELSDSHRLSQYLIILIRLAFETPEKIGETDHLIESMVKLGMSPCAKEFYDGCRKEISDMHKKIDAIYDMCLKMYTLSEFGKCIGLEGKAKNMARAEFMCERQLSQLCDKLGIREKGIFESAKLTSIEGKSAEILEYIINHYDGAVSEIKVEYTPVNINIPDVNVIKSGQVVTVADSYNNDTVIEAKPTETPDTTISDDDDLEVDFGDTPKTEVKFEGHFSDTADLGDLKNFFGGDDLD